MMKDRKVKLSEMTIELQKSFEKNGDCEITSIGTSSGSNSSFIFHTDVKDIYVKCMRSEKEL